VNLRLAHSATGTHVGLEESSRTITVPVGKTLTVLSPCAAGEAVTGGGPTNILRRCRSRHEPGLGHGVHRPTGRYARTRLVALVRPSSSLARDDPFHVEDLHPLGAAVVPLDLDHVELVVVDTRHNPVLLTAPHDSPDSRHAADRRSGYPSVAGRGVGRIP
jgi:hypothetical protein